jgi:predicted MFS family arabinose efflux permease
MTIVAFIFLAESHGPTIQRWRAKSKTDTFGSNNEEKPSTVSSLSRALVRPMKMLLFSPIVTGMSLYLALVYSYSYLLFTTFAAVFTEQYGFGTEFLGLSFLGLGFGYLLALLVLSWLSDWIQDHLTRKHGESKPEYAAFHL